MNPEKPSATKGHFHAAKFARRAALASAVAAVAPAAAVSTSAALSTEAANLAGADFSGRLSDPPRQARPGSSNPLNFRSFLRKAMPKSTRASKPSSVNTVGRFKRYAKKADLRRLCHLAQAAARPVWRAYALENGDGPPLSISKPLVEREKNPLEEYPAWEKTPDASQNP